MQCYLAISCGNLYAEKQCNNKVLLFGAKAAANYAPPCITICCMLHACTEDTEPLVAATDADDYSWMPYQIARADYIPFQQKLAIEEQAYFVPSVIEREKYSSSSHLHDLIKDLVNCSQMYSTVSSFISVDK